MIEALVVFVPNWGFGTSEDSVKDFVIGLLLGALLNQRRPKLVIVRKRRKHRHSRMRRNLRFPSGKTEAPKPLRAETSVRHETEERT